MKREEGNPTLQCVKRRIVSLVGSSGYVPSHTLVQYLTEEINRILYVRRATVLSARASSCAAGRYPGTIHSRHLHVEYRRRLLRSTTYQGRVKEF